MNKPIVLPYEAGAIKLTAEQAAQLFTPAELEAGRARGKAECVGPWQIVKSFTALCTSNTFNRESYPVGHGPLHVYGKRTLSKARASGYELEGTVSVGGKKWRGFTSSQLFQLPDGKYVDAAIIHACGVVD